ncbi:hypothetical protein, partial [Enterococcus plantarum]|uniref:hypothetical protein n=1 Tax=Enterococcus plantarum TaxID=1077675 RepID=UPI001A9002A1
MYKMNVINFIENHSDRPSIYSKDLKIEYFNINDIIIYENVNAFLIKESEHSRGSIFELVMQIKKNSKAIIFLITDTNSRGIRLTYLNIGVDIILTKDLDSDEMYIEICKILNLINKEKISKY